MQPVISLTPYELGQIVALLPESAWMRMDADLRKKIAAAKFSISNSDQQIADLAVETDK